MPWEDVPRLAVVTLTYPGNGWRYARTAPRSSGTCGRSVNGGDGSGMPHGVRGCWSSSPVKTGPSGSSTPRTSTCT